MKKYNEKFSKAHIFNTGNGEKNNKKKEQEKRRNENLMNTFDCALFQMVNLICSLNKYEIVYLKYDI